MIKSFLRDGDQLMEQLTDFCPTTLGDEVVKNSVSEILHDVHKNGDEAVLSRTLLYDKAKLASGEIRVTQDELKKVRITFPSRNHVPPVIVMQLQHRPD